MKAVYFAYFETGGLHGNRTTLIKKHSTESFFDWLEQARKEMETEINLMAAKDSPINPPIKLKTVIINCGVIK